MEGGVGVDLTQENVILELRPGTAAAHAAESGGGLQVGDHVLSVDGVSLGGRPEDPADGPFGAPPLVSSLAEEGAGAGGDAPRR